MTVTLPTPARRNANEGGASLPASHDHDVMVDARAIRHPVFWIATEQAERGSRVCIEIFCSVHVNFPERSILQILKTKGVTPEIWTVG